MKNLISFFVAVTLILTGAVFAAEKGSHPEKGSGYEEKIGSSSKSEIQAAMLNYIHNNTCEGKDKCALGLISTEFDYLHEGVKHKDGYFISCADFKAGDDVYDVDYYVKQEDATYTVVKVMLHKINGESINQILWHEEEGKGSGHEHKGSERERKGSAGY